MRPMVALVAQVAVQRHLADAARGNQRDAAGGVLGRAAARAIPASAVGQRKAAGITREGEEIGLAADRQRVGAVTAAGCALDAGPQLGVPANAAAEDIA